MRNILLQPDAAAPDPVAAARAAAAVIGDEAAAIDRDGGFPKASIAALAAHGLLHAPLPGSGGCLATDAGAVATLRALLTTVGYASLSVGRLYEGHVNAVGLAVRAGAAPVLAVLAAEADAGRPSGVWNAERGDGTWAVTVPGGWQVYGTKVFCSGAGAVRRPVVPVALAGTDRVQMLLPDLAQPGVEIDTGWRAAGMRGTVSGTVRFDGLFVGTDSAIGGPDDYFVSPWFAGGAWRVLAVQQGGVARLIELHATELGERRADDAVTRARFAAAAGAAELARLLVDAAAARVAAGASDAAAIDAYVDLARGSFTELAHSVMALTRQNLGIDAFLAPGAIDRTGRDLDTYLRQPGLDASRDRAARFLLGHGGRWP